VGNLLLRLECPSCKRAWSPREPVGHCVACSRTLRAIYDMEAAKNRLSVHLWDSRPPGLWRFEELLPLEDPSQKVSLGEVETPLLRVAGNGPDRGFLLKLDGVLPTGSFKARGMAMAVSRARELGLRKVAVPSAGNAGGALAAYARRAGLEATIFLPRDSPGMARTQIQLYGARLEEVAGHIGDAARACREYAAQTGAFDLSTLREPYRAQGKKTMGLEIFWQTRGSTGPDVIIYPTGGGTGILGLAWAFEELRSLGWIDRLPRLYAAQSEGCGPVVEALERHRTRVSPVPEPRTLASGLRVPSPFSSEDILAAIRLTQGGGVCVSDEEMVKEVRSLARRAGVWVSWEVGAALAGRRKLLETEAIEPGETVLVYGTGAGWLNDPTPSSTGRSDF